MKILIVEDSATLRAHLKKLVIDIGHHPLFANSGVEALQLVGSAEFDLVIMDVEMPGLDGFETTSLMREALGEHWIPIIYSTSHDSDDKVLDGIEAGGDDYLVKPISRNLLKAKLMSMQRIAGMHQQLTRLNNELSALSQYDGLTNLLNRRAFSEKAEQCLRDVRRFGKPCAMLLMDVDFFKQFNDLYGHLNGDQCLKDLARILQNTVNRESDLVGRYGGEEFIVLLPDTDPAGAVLVAERILNAVDKENIPHASSSIARHVTLSIGVEVATPAHRLSLETLTATADKNLYLAKEKGRHRIYRSFVTDKTLLIVDDSDQRLTQLTELLQPMGNIITAESADECLELAKEIIPDIVIIGKHFESSDDSSGALDKKLASHVRTARIPVSYIDTEDTADISDQIKALLQ